MSSGLKKVNSNLKGRPSTLWTMSVGCPGNGRQPLEEPYTVQWVRWPISYGDQPLTGEPDAGEPPVRFGARGDSSIVPTPNLRRGGHKHQRPYLLSEKFGCHPGYSTIFR